MNERHVRRVLGERIGHYNRGRPHASLGPGIPDLPANRVVPPSNGHRIPAAYKVAGEPVLGGLHHDYRLLPRAA